MQSRDLDHVGTPLIHEPDSCAESGWWPCAALSEPLVDHTVVALTRVAAERTHTERRWPS
ncbi:hypothetical protein AQ490_17490 [Wenjunlia vitaminophila]|uniref:Uncharacterized protein n=1 Tax=Wenjunlia vitaminophila TaxID=76728 RepID=A0A0T6LVE6_WENVI|nr:hypothetical protein AQ490_17490 [Wenjunlia vitaminophila]